MPNTKTYSISDLSKEFDVTTRTIRFYEEKGLLKPQRQGSARIYSNADRTTLKLVLRGKRLGFSLDESLEIISMYDSGLGGVEQLQRMLNTIREKRSALEQQLHDIELMMLDLRDSEEKCLAALADFDVQLNPTNQLTN